MAEVGGVDAAGRRQQAWEVRGRHFAPRIRFDRPLATIAVSVTGAACALRCAHCNGHYLSGMHALQDEAVGRSRSLLISGGCDGLGRVPVLPHLQEIAAAGRGKRLNWHVGLIDEETTLAIRPYVDVVSFDFVGDDETIREVYGLQRSVKDYAGTYSMLRRHLRVVPHLTLGLRGGRLSGERRALTLLRELGLEALVFIVFTPTAGTAYAEREPPPIGAVADVLAEARLLLPETPLIVGCMRPAGSYREALDELAVHLGLNGIVNPARTAVAAAEELGLAVDWGEECCAL